MAEIVQIERQINEVTKSVQFISDQYVEQKKKSKNQN